jgi:putative phage-type endonuclease
MSAAPQLVQCEQRSAEWIALRVGKVTSSRINDVLATIKKGEAAGRRNYRADLVVETLTGNPVEEYISKEMQWGIDTEPFGCAAYQVAQDVDVEKVGFAVHPFIPRFGASPDGLVGDDGMVEIKCPNTATHIEYLLGGVVPADYQDQMLAQMACTGRQWSDFVSYDPRLPEHLQLFICRLHRDDARIADIEGKVVKFLSEVDDVLVQLGAAQCVIRALPLEARQRRLLTEVKNCLDFYFPGKAKTDAQIRVAICDLIFELKSCDLLDSLSAEKLERGWRILRAYERFANHDLKTVEGILRQITDAIHEYDSGQSQEWELPF